jgi:microcystin-dependent protein
MDNNAFTGTIKLFGGNFAPVEWLLCDGSLLQISQYNALYAAIGTTYGGDGSTTFAIPDLRGRIPVCSGNGPGLTLRTAGSKGGTEQVTLIANDISAHSHALAATDAVATSRGATSASLPAESQGRIYAPPAASPVAMSPAAISTVGGGQPHDNIQPSLSINHIICTNGLSPSLGDDFPTPFIGEIALNAGLNSWHLWTPCDGRLVQISTNTALFSLLGTTYGGDGRTTFALPDLRGRVPMGAGFGPGLTSRFIGDSPGEAQVTLTVDQLPPHTHQLFASGATGLSNDPANSVLSVPFSGDNLYGPPTAGPLVSMQAVQANTGGQPHDNMQPYLSIMFLMATSIGIFPERP